MEALAPFANVSWDKKNTLIDNIYNWFQRFQAAMLTTIMFVSGQEGVGKQEAVMTIGTWRSLQQDLHQVR